MTVEFGFTVVGCTEDFEGNLEAICEALNKFEGWNADDEKFVYKDGVIVMPPCEAASVIPELIVGYYVDEENTILKAVEKMTEEEQESCNVVETEEVELAEICTAVSPLITSGGLIITATAVHDGEAMSFGQLLIFADDTAERTINFSASNKPTFVRHDVFPEA